MGPSRYNHLITFQPVAHIGLCAGCDDLKRPSGERATRNNLRDFSLNSTVQSSLPYALYPNAPARLPPRPAGPRGPSRLQQHHIAQKSAQESFRVISTARLRTSPPVHLPPINVVVCNDPIWRSHLEVGFVLRCFQHLSVPDAATRPCPWRDNRLAGGRSNTVLSY